MRGVLPIAGVRASGAGHSGEVYDPVAVPGPQIAFHPQLAEPLPTEVAEWFEKSEPRVGRRSRPAAVSGQRLVVPA